MRHFQSALYLSTAIGIRLLGNGHTFLKYQKYQQEFPLAGTFSTCQIPQPLIFLKTGEKKAVIYSHSIPLKPKNHEQVLLFKKKKFLATFPAYYSRTLAHMPQLSF